MLNINDKQIDNIDYKKLYLELFNSVSDTIKTLQACLENAEDDYLDQGENECNSL